jgi:hypothetical protein
MIDRRRLIATILATLASPALTAHTPYRQWKLYRKQHLLIGTSKTDAPSFPLGKQVAELLVTYLPESSARVTRAPDQERLASLITTGQMELVLLSRDDTAALAAGRAPFEDFGETALTALFTFGDYVLVCRPDFPDRHAWLVVGTLTEHAGEIDGAKPAEPGKVPVPVHSGALAYAQGEPEPPPIEAVVEDLPKPRVH